MDRNLRVLFIGALPEPTTGQAVAGLAFLRELERHHIVDVVNLSKPSFVNGLAGSSRLIQLIGIFCRVFVFRWRADCIYFTVSESRAGNLKDLVIYTLLLGRLNKVVIHLHGGAGMRRLLREHRGLIRRGNVWILKRVGGVIVLGSRLRDIFSDIVPAERLHVVANFAAKTLFTNREAVILKFVENDPLRILFLSNLLPGKGHYELLAAFLSLPKATQARCRLDFGGGFESNADERRFREAIACSDRIEYHGVVNGDFKVQLFQQAHLFVLPTYYPYEGQPISILEAYAAGCVVLTTDHSGIFDVFSPIENGFEVVPRSVESVLEALRQAVAARDSLLPFALRNVELAEQRFTEPAYAAELRRIVHSVALNVVVDG